MVQRNNRMSSVLKSWMFIFYLHEGASNIICPDVVELDSHARLSCPISGSANPVLYHTPEPKPVATCFSDRSSCTIPGNLQRFNGTVVNETLTYLEISDVQLSDEGSWKCEDQNNDITTNCSLELMKTPSCNITSYRYTSELYVGDEITLSVDIQKYYCSRSLEMLLITGNATHKLIEIKAAQSIQNKTINSTFMLTDSHFGSVEVNFICNNLIKNVQCQGENVLVKHHPETNPATTSDVSLNRKGSGDSNIVIIAGATAAAAVVIIIAVVFVIVYVVKKHCKSAKKDNSPCDDVVDNVNTRSKSIRVTTYEDIGDVNGAVGNYGYENYTAGCTNDVEMVVTEGYMPGDDAKTHDPRTYYSLLPETTLRSEHVYTQFTKNSKVHN